MDISFPMVHAYFIQLLQIVEMEYSKQVNSVMMIILSMVTGVLHFAKFRQIAHAQTMLVFILIRYVIFQQM